MNNFAFIDSQNLNLAIKAQGWILDFGRFRRYLDDKLDIKVAFLFLGYCSEYQKLYNYLKKVGFILIFKPVSKLKNGRIKGNIDAELVLHTMLQYPNFDKAVIVSNDGDFYCLVKYLKKSNKLLKLIIPHSKSYSLLFREFKADIIYMDFLKEKLQRV